MILRPKQNTPKHRGKSTSHTIFDETTILPDGTRWHPGVDMRRFTDPDHPDFWHPQRVKSDPQG